MNYAPLKQKYVRRNQDDFINKTLSEAFMVHKKLSNILLKQVKMRIRKKPTISKEINMLIFFLENNKKSNWKVNSVAGNIKILEKCETFIFRENIQQ